ncbi:hypothetical protein FGO68_gene10415 [Halteria grandinella]|uniref:Uncharacterized protein n=1 Tax=Halteria grandinella TaxID=5974 RepID=A0A8J8ND65_HALGN|nr:hypothetical protein FGO68_gene10415 [Halteria grandinella]
MVIEQYSSTTQSVFMVFIAFQVLTFVLRGLVISVMKEDVFKSRGILNLIPEELFEENREQVEKLIKKLKD